MDVFCEIPCLTERSPAFSAFGLRKSFFPGAHKNFLGEALQKFVAYNRKSFEFLDVTPTIVGTDQGTSILFRTSRYVGAVPLRAPDTGKQIGDFVVTPRFVGRDRFVDYIEILDLLGGEINPEVIDSLPLVSGRNFRPPFYLEAAKFIGSIERMLRHPWRKFDSVEVVSDLPSGQINWKKYIQHENRAESKLRFPIRKNVLSQLHREYGQLRFVFDICKKELSSANAPQRIRAAFQSRLSFIENRLYLHKPVPAETVDLRASDSLSVKECKKQANRVLRREFIDSTSWRVDFNDVYEKFVQYILREVARSIGGKLFTNPRIRTKTPVYYAWELRHLEPDAVLQADDLVAFVDAKYKSHLYNKFEVSELLRNDYRRDLHQVLAYTSFTPIGERLGIICYPSADVEVKATRFLDAFNASTNRLLIVGIPLKRNVISEAVQRLKNEVDEHRAKYLDQNEKSIQP